MKQYQALLRKNLGGIVGVALLAVLTSFAMVFAGYSLSFLFTAYEQEGDRVCIRAVYLLPPATIRRSVSAV